MKHYLYIVGGLLLGAGIQYLQEPIAISYLLRQVQTARQNTTDSPAPAARIPPYINRIPAPAGYQLIHTPENVFGNWLQQLPLRSNNTLYLYNGKPKAAQWFHYAILNVPYNGHPLQQCADAVMRLRAEYLYATKSEPFIRFLHRKNEYFTCPTACTRPQLETFLTLVFSWCGTYNLQAQLHPVKNIQQVQAGDVFVKGCSPGHAMLVAAVAQNKQGRKVFLLLQSFIPAQDIHLVKNTLAPSLSPWYSADSNLITTPGYTFRPGDLRRW